MAKGRKVLSAAVVLVVVSLVTGAAVVYRRAYWPRKFGVVVDGLYRSGQPNGRQLTTVAGKYGLRTVLSLRGDGATRSDPDGVSEMEAARALGVRFINITSESQPGDEVVKEFFRIADDPANRPLLFHCHRGTIRTGALAAFFRMTRCGWTFEEALSEAARYGFDASRVEYPWLVECLRAHAEGED